jgi:hypothetical protein
MQHPISDDHALQNRIDSLQRRINQLKSDSYAKDRKNTDIKLMAWSLSMLGLSYIAPVAVILPVLGMCNDIYQRNNYKLPEAIKNLHIKDPGELDQLIYQQERIAYSETQEADPTEQLAHDTNDIYSEYYAYLKEVDTLITAEEEKFRKQQNKFPLPVMQLCLISGAGLCLIGKAVINRSHTEEENNSNSLRY